MAAKEKTTTGGAETLCTGFMKTSFHCLNIQAVNSLHWTHSIFFFFCVCAVNTSSRLFLSECEHVFLCRAVKKLAAHSSSRPPGSRTLCVCVGDLGFSLWVWSCVLKAPLPCFDCEQGEAHRLRLSGSGCRMLRPLQHVLMGHRVPAGWLTRTEIWPSSDKMSLCTSAVFTWSSLKDAS